MVTNQPPNLPDDEDDLTILPIMHTTSVKRANLGLKEMNIGQYFLSQDSFDSFVRLPTSMSDPAPAAAWQIELGLDGLGVPPLRLEIVGPVVIGRGQDVDINLSEYKAIDYGLSRRHAMLRPSKQALYFIELNSSNGSRINGIDVTADRVHIVALGDVIRLGTLTIVVRFLRLKP